MFQIKSSTYDEAERWDTWADENFWLSADDSYATRPEEITLPCYVKARCLRSICDRQRGTHSESFKLVDGHRSGMTAIYARVGVWYVLFRGPSMMSHDEIVACATAALAQSGKYVYEAA